MGIGTKYLYSFDHLTSRARKQPAPGVAVCRDRVVVVVHACKNRRSLFILRRVEGAISLPYSLAKFEDMQQYGILSHK